MRRTVSLIIGILAVLLGATGCDKEPMNKLVNPLLSNTTGNWSGVWVLYDDEVKTGGDIMNYTTHEGVALQFDCRDNPHSGTQCIRFSWDGGDVTSYADGRSEHDWTGFGMIVAASYLDYTKFAKDLSTAGFTKITFWVRGSLNSNVFLRLEANNATSDSNPPQPNCWASNLTNYKVTSAWKQYSIPLSGSQTAVKDYLRIVLKSALVEGRSNGGTVYLDDVELTK